ncbi:MAG: hypothetical protein PHI78_02390 [Clostridia bacterium]|nr:hypothetical protein [Clostridia bacterium]
MKKSLVLILLALIIVSTMVSGSLAVYTTSQEITSGDISAKLLIFEINKISGFDQSLEIAPTESYTYIFNITNTKGYAVSQVAIDATITVSLGAADGKTAIGNLVAEIYSDGVKIADIPVTDGVGSIDLTKHFDLTAETFEYEVVITWISSADDNLYMGSSYGSVLTVNGVAVQGDVNEGGGGEEEEDPDPLMKQISDYLFQNRYTIFNTTRNFTIYYNSNDGVTYKTGVGSSSIANDLTHTMENQFLSSIPAGTTIYIYVEQSNRNLRILVATEDVMYGAEHYYDKTVDRNDNVVYVDYNY